MPTTDVLSADRCPNSHRCDQQQVQCFETPACTAMLPERLAVGSHLPPCLKLERRLNCYCPNVSTILGSPHPSQGQRAYTAQAQCNRQLVYDKKCLQRHSINHSPSTCAGVCLRRPALYEKRSRSWPAMAHEGIAGISPRMTVSQAPLSRVSLLLGTRLRRTMRRHKRWPLRGTFPLQSRTPHSSTP